MQVDPTSNKACPKCQAVCNVMVGQCHKCGHLFRTKFVAAPPPSPGQTQVFSAPQSLPHKPQLAQTPANPQNDAIKKVAILLLFALLMVAAIYAAWFAAQYKKTAPLRESRQAEQDRLVRLYGPKPPVSSNGVWVQFEELCRKYANDPSSIEIVDASSFVATPDYGWKQTVTIRGKNGFGAKVVSESTLAVLFGECVYLDMGGEVLDKRKTTNSSTADHHEMYAADFDYVSQGLPVQDVLRKYGKPDRYVSSETAASFEYDVVDGMVVIHSEGEFVTRVDKNTGSESAR